MPARDFYHNAVKAALIKDGWIITADPYIIKYENTKLFADLAAERTLAAERNGTILLKLKAINIYGFRLAGKKIAELKVLLYIFGLKITKFGLKKTGLKKVLPPNY